MPGLRWRGFKLRRADADVKVRTPAPGTMSCTRTRLWNHREGLPAADAAIMQPNGWRSPLTRHAQLCVRSKLSSIVGRDGQAAPARWLSAPGPGHRVHRPSSAPRQLSSARC